MPRLIVQDGPGAGSAYELLDDLITIGRDPGNIVQLPSEAVSRNHAALSRRGSGEGEAWEVRDLGSKNGVFLNGRRITVAELASADEMRLGDVTLRFILQDLEPVEPQMLAGADEGLAVTDTLKGDAILRPTATRPTTTTEPGPQARLLALVELSRLAASAASFVDLFAAIAHAVETNLQPHRAVPILFDERKGMLRPWAGGRSDFDRHLAEAPISSTIVNHVRDKRTAVLSEAVSRDERFRQAESITAHHIASAMAAPILLGDRLLGVIYADRLGNAPAFTKADLEMLTAIAAQSAAAIENVRIREEVARERSRREKEERIACDIIGQSEPMQKVLRFIAKAAPTDASVLIEGESGTGKELVARALHVNSTRRHQAFEAVNCAAMAPTLLESELFGHQRGAFTGADRERPGRFELADGGTLFLDEIGELPDSSQSKLLRAIETGEVRRLGDVRDRRVNVRVIAATNKKLNDEVAAKRFREDLYFRLNVLRIALPPLRERPGDVRLLAAHYLAQFSAKCGKGKLILDEGVLALFEGYPWPGNVRELRNAVERMVVMAEGSRLTLEEVPYEVRTGRPPTGVETTAISLSETGLRPLRDVERDYIDRVLRSTNGNKKEAARVLGIDRSTLYAKIKTYDLQAKDDEP